MGLDLKILPLYSENYTDFSTDVLAFSRHSDIFEKILELEKKKGVHVKRGGIHSFCGEGKGGERGFGVTEISPFGARLKL